MLQVNNLHGQCLVVFPEYGSDDPQRSTAGGMIGYGIQALGNARGLAVSVQCDITSLFLLGGTYSEIASCLRSLVTSEVQNSDHLSRTLFEK